jgi:hypothetical protein
VPPVAFPPSLRRAAAAPAYPFAVLRRAVFCERLSSSNRAEQSLGRRVIFLTFSGWRGDLSARDLPGKRFTGMPGFSDAEIFSGVVMFPCFLPMCSDHRFPGA